MHSEFTILCDLVQPYLWFANVAKELSKSSVGWRWLSYLLLCPSFELKLIIVDRYSLLLDLCLLLFDLICLRHDDRQRKASTPTDFNNFPELVYLLVASQFLIRLALICRLFASAGLLLIQVFSASHHFALWALRQRIVT